MGTIVTLTPQRADRIDALVAAGQFASSEDVVEQLLAEVLDPVPVYSTDELAELREAAIEADRGEFVSPEETTAFFDEWKRNG
jgi:Arc/MetJ-type ribon-helix-helix transcriptional regulator